MGSAFRKPVSGETFGFYIGDHRQLLHFRRNDAWGAEQVGTCFGGAVGVEFGATGAPLVANVSIHGSFRDHEAGWAKNAKGMYLILHGAEDESYPLTTVSPRRNGVTW
jgi:dienelactone hydrolase